MKNKLIENLKTQIANSEWTGYVTYYPHKKAYRPLPRLNMSEVWENVNELTLYVHIPFCERKCTFCNLFSTVLKEEEKELVYEHYVNKVLEEIEFYSSKVNKNATVLTVYFGGGTPNVLTAIQIEKIMQKLKVTFPNWDKNIEVTMECAPELLTLDYMINLKSIGIHRLSVGVQTLVESELKLINRKSGLSHITNIREWAKITNLNINFDLIYGLPTQTRESFLYSLNKIIKLSPESICTYPLAIRPHTKINKLPETLMFDMKEKYNFFEEIRTHLEQHSYTLETIVRFTKSANSTCQMEKYEYQGLPTLGFGAGARSYAPSVNYSITYKVQDKLVKSIIEAYLSTNASDRTFDGYVYNEEDHKIKYAMLNLIGEGLNETLFQKKFGVTAKETFQDELEALDALHLITFNKENATYSLTRTGMQYCDLVANIFVSSTVQNLYDSYKPE